MVSLVPKAEDPDKDTLTFTFTSPLDDNGEWQTNYGDAGEYTVTITASDGLLTTSKEVLIIVKKKEEAPVLESFEPKDTLIKIDETGTVWWINQGQKIGFSTMESLRTQGLNLQNIIIANYYDINLQQGTII